MKSRSTISVIAVLVLVAAIIMLITRFDFNHMDGDDWTILLIIAGVLLGVIALIVRSSSKTEEEPFDELKLKQTELKLQELHKSGILTEEKDSSVAPSNNPSEGGTEELLRDKDFMKQLYDSGVITYPEYSKIEKALTMERVGAITHEQFLQELPDTVGAKIDEIKQQKLADEEKYRKLHEALMKLEQLRDAGILTQEEFKVEKRKLYSR